MASRTWEVNAQYGKAAGDNPGVAVSMTYRHREASVGPSGVGVDGTFFQSAPDADLAASSSVKVTDRMQLQGGVVARYMGTGTSAYGIAPAATARYDFGPATLWVRGLYRVVGSTANPTSMPRVGSIEDSLEPAATQSSRSASRSARGPTRCCSSRSPSSAWASWSARSSKATS